MARLSAERVTRARRRQSETALLGRIAASADPPALDLHETGFDVIAEIKRTAPSAGRLERRDDDVARRSRRYAAGGAAAVSVLTEPSRFDGHLEDLELAAAALGPLGVPVLRKDFLVDPYQVLEARAAGAAGVLVIVRLADDAQLTELVDCAHRAGVFVLLEAFDRQDLERIGRLVEAHPKHSANWLAGVNSRDLATLQIDPRRLEVLAPALPPALPGVAESGLSSGRDAADVAALGYRLALVGTALMLSPEPEWLIGDLLHAARSRHRAGS